VPYRGVWDDVLDVAAKRVLVPPSPWGEEGDAELRRAQLLSRCSATEIPGERAARGAGGWGVGAGLAKPGFCWGLAGVVEGPCAHLGCFPPRIFI